MSRSLIGFLVGLMSTCLISFVIAEPVLASERESGLDTKLGFGARSMPLGAAAFAEFGYGIPIWGQWRERSSFSYGYIRPRAVASSALTVNSGDIAVSLHPISFLAFTFGRGWSARVADQSKIVDCSYLECGGVLRSDYGAVDLTLAWMQIFFIGSLEARDIQASSDQEDFYEDSISIVGRKGSDRVSSHGAIVGWRAPLENGFFVGLGGRRSEMHSAGTFSERLTLLSGHRFGDLRFSYSAGLYRSSLQASALTVGALFEWRPLRGLALD